MDNIKLKSYGSTVTLKMHRCLSTCVRIGSRQFLGIYRAPLKHVRLPGASIHHYHPYDHKWVKYLFIPTARERMKEGTNKKSKEMNDAMETKISQAVSKLTKNRKKDKQKYTQNKAVTKIII